MQVTTTIVSGNAPQYQIRTPSGASQPSIDVTAWDASIVSDPATLTGRGHLIAGYRQFVTEYDSRHHALDLRNGGPGSKATLNTATLAAAEYAAANYPLLEPPTVQQQMAHQEPGTRKRVGPVPPWAR